MRNSDELASDLIFALSNRITANPAPTWPLPIFEAEADLYDDFLCDMLSALDGMRSAGATDQDIAASLRTPSRIVELSYFLLGASRSGLEINDRRRLAGTLATALACARPLDPLCERGANLLLDQTGVAELADAQAHPTQPDQSTALPRLRAALIALGEMLHVGISQYGREIHGPYTLSADLFMIVRDYFDFRMPEVWPSTADFAIDRIRITETYSATPAILRFDISNHITAYAPLQDLLRGHSVSVLTADGTEHIENADTLIGTVLTAHGLLLSTTAGFTNDEWLRQHRRARYHYLTPLIERSGHPGRGMPETRLPTDPGIKGDVERWHDIPSLELYGRLCTELGLPRRVG